MRFLKKGMTEIMVSRVLEVLNSWKPKRSFLYRSSKFTYIITQLHYVCYLIARLH